MHSDVKRIVKDCLNRHFLVRELSSFLLIFREIRIECAALGCTPPARETIKARLDAMDEREVFRRRRE